MIYKFVISLNSNLKPEICSQSLNKNVFLGQQNDYMYTHQSIKR